MAPTNGPDRSFPRDPLNPALYTPDTLEVLRQVLDSGAEQVSRADREAAVEGVLFQLAFSVAASRAERWLAKAREAARGADGSAEVDATYEGVMEVITAAKTLYNVLGELNEKLPAGD